MIYTNSLISDIAISKEAQRIGLGLGSVKGIKS
jgi:hypothetical protein